MTLQSWLDLYASEYNEVDVVDKNYEPLLSWLNDDPKYKAEVIDDYSGTVRINWMKGE